MNRAKRKSNGRKFAVLVAMLCIVSVSAFATAIVFAATNIKGSGTTNITYSATGTIIGSVDASYTLGNEAKTTWGTVNYDGSEGESSTKSLEKTLNIAFTASNNTVVYEFLFKADTGTSASAKGYSATLSFKLGSEKSAENVKVYYSTDNTSWGDAFTIGSDEVVLSNTALDVRSATGTSAFVKVEMINALDDVNFGGTFGWTLVKNNA